jgi:hypothetical protein
VIMTSIEKETGEKIGVADAAREFGAFAATQVP